jgi:hypothetical protein
MTRTIPTRLTHLKFSKLMEWAKENNNILQSLDRTELAKLASVALNFPVASSTFTPLSDALGVRVGKPHAEKKVSKEVARMAQIEDDIRILANAFQAFSENQIGKKSPHVDRILARNKETS